jgi:site-specific recombinase XerD
VLLAADTLFINCARCGSRLIEQGQHKDVVQRVLNHRDPRFTHEYAELHDDQVRAALEARW